MPRKRSILREEASGAIKTLKRLDRTNPSVRMIRMDDYLAIYHKTSDAPSQYPLSMSKAYVEVDFEGGRIWSDKDTEKTRSHESFSWHWWNDWLPSHLQQKAAKSIIPECSCFHFLGKQTRTAFMACCSHAKSGWNAEFRVDDRLRPLQTHFIRVAKSYLHSGTRYQSWQATKLWFNMFFCLWIFFCNQTLYLQWFTSWHVRFAFLAQWSERCALCWRKRIYWVG